MSTQKNNGRYALDQSPLYMLSNRKKLGKMLRIDTRELRLLSKQADSLYKEFSVPKKAGG